MQIMLSFFDWNIQGVIRNTELWKFKIMECIILGTFKPATLELINRSLKKQPIKIVPNLNKSAGSHKTA